MITRGYFTNSGWMPSVALITVGRLHENGRIAEAFGKHFAADVVEPHTFADVTSRLLHHRVAIHVGQQAQAEALRIAGIGEPVDGDRRLRRVERLAHPSVQFVVTDRTPKGRFAVHDRLGVDRRTR